MSSKLLIMLVAGWVVFGVVLVGLCITYLNTDVDSVPPVNPPRVEMSDALRQSIMAVIDDPKFRFVTSGEPVAVISYLGLQQGTNPPRPDKPEEFQISLWTKDGTEWVAKWVAKKP